MTMDSGAKVILNTEATPELVEKEKPDAVFIAIGSRPLTLKIPGIDGGNVKHVLDVDNGRAEVGKKVVVCGGGLSGQACALALAMEGKEVTVLDMIPPNVCRVHVLHRTQHAYAPAQREQYKACGSSVVERFTDKASRSSTASSGARPSTPTRLSRLSA
jgi:pyruvate/2-oxoglutarate dehydrogenase complex dihydrolipoamide dehydrogenase (E3) component